MCNFYKIGNKTICRLGEFLFVISILVLVGSLLFVMVYALFLIMNMNIYDFNNGLLYIAVLGCITNFCSEKLFIRVQISFLKSNSKETKSKKRE